jgi:hypothetical protein
MKEFWVFRVGDYFFCVLYVTTLTSLHELITHACNLRANASNSTA